MTGEKESNGRRINAELIIAISAIVISVLTAVVSAYQTKIMREQQYSSVWPYIQWDMTIDSREGSEITVYNKGVGPAIIRSTSLSFDGKQIDVLGYVKNLVGNSDSVSLYYSSVDSTVISPGDKSVLFKITAPPAVLARIPKDAFKRTRFEIVYSDIYTSCWISSGNKVVETRCNE